MRGCVLAAVVACGGSAGNGSVSTSETAGGAACAVPDPADFDQSCSVPEDCVVVTLDGCFPANVTSFAAVHVGQQAAFVDAFSGDCSCHGSTTTGSLQLRADCTGGTCAVVAY